SRNPLLRLRSNTDAIALADSAKRKRATGRMVLLWSRQTRSSDSNHNTARSRGCLGGTSLALIPFQTEIHFSFPPIFIYYYIILMAQCQELSLEFTQFICVDAKVTHRHFSAIPSDRRLDLLFSLAAEPY